MRCSIWAPRVTISPPFLFKYHPTIECLLGSADNIPLQDEAVDLVVAAQAFHWFAHRKTLEACARVLKPGGHLALIWNTRDDSVPWVNTLERFIDTLYVTCPEGLVRHITTVTHSLFLQTQLPPRCAKAANRRLERMLRVTTLVWPS